MSHNILLYSQILFHKIFSYGALKLATTGAYLTLYFFFNSVEMPALIALFFLIIFDFATGILASYKTGVEIQSTKIFRTALKILIYYGMISASHLTELAGFSFIPIEETVIAILAATEMVSLLENVALLGYITPKKILNKLREFTVTNINK